MAGASAALPLQAQRDPGACAQGIPAVPGGIPSPSRWRGWTHRCRGPRAAAAGAAGAWCGRLGAEGGTAGAAAPRPVGPACGHHPPTFLQRPRPRGKQVGLVSPGAFVLFERPPARRAENRCLCAVGWVAASPWRGDRGMSRGDVPHRPRQGQPVPPTPTPGATRPVPYGF